MQQREHENVHNRFLEEWGYVFDDDGNISLNTSIVRAVDFPAPFSDPDMDATESSVPSSSISTPSPNKKDDSDSEYEPSQSSNEKEKKDKKETKKELKRMGKSKGGGRGSVASSLAFTDDEVCHICLFFSPIFVELPDIFIAIRENTPAYPKETPHPRVNRHRKLTG